MSWVAILTNSYILTGFEDMVRIDSSLILTSSSSVGSRDPDIDEEAWGRAIGGLLGIGADFATGRDKPRNLPRLATPTPQVNCVLYPEHFSPTLRHCEQYGRRRSHLVFLLEQAKQSGALRRRFCFAAGQGSGRVIAEEVSE